MICWKVAHPRTSHPAGHHQLAMSAESRETHVSAHSQVLLPVSTISTCSSSLPNCCCSLTAAASPTCCANLLLQCLHQNDQLAFKYVVSRVSQAGCPGGTQVPARFAGSSGPLDPESLARVAVGGETVARVFLEGSISSPASHCSMAGTSVL